MALNARYQVFVDSYLATFNRTQAALAAGYSPRTAYSQGARLLKNVEVSAAIRDRLQETAMTADEVLMRLSAHARGDISDFLDDNGYFDLTKARAAQKTSLIKKLKTKTTTRVIGEMEVTTTEVEFELYDAQAANRLIGEHYALFKGSQEAPQHVVTHTQAEWEAAQAKRQAEVTQAIADFADDDAAEPATDE